MTERGALMVGACVLVGFSMYYLIAVDYRIALGVFLFGWALNIDNDLKRRGK